MAFDLKIDNLKKEYGEFYNKAYDNFGKKKKYLKTKK